MEMLKTYAASRKETVWVYLLNLLNRPVGFIMNMTSRIIAKVACWSQDLMTGSDLQFYLTWLKDQLRAPVSAMSIAYKASIALALLHNFIQSQGNEYIQSVARCLQMMLRIDDYRQAFVHLEGVSTLISVLSGRVNFQIQYQLSFCLWVLSFNPDIAEKLNKYVVYSIIRPEQCSRVTVAHFFLLRRFGVIPILADILTDAQKEKVSRIILAVFRVSGNSNNTELRHFAHLALFI